MIEVCFRYMERQPFKLPSASTQIKPTWSKAFEKLRYELARIEAVDVVIESGYKPGQVRADGWPYSNARPEHGQARVSFKRAGVPMSFYFGGWQALEYNVYMIAMTLEALRAVDRYGCAAEGQQYRGWAQLPAGNAITAAEWKSKEDAAGFLAKTAGYIGGGAEGSIRAVANGDPEYLREFHRDAAKNVHPDVTRDNGNLMAKVNRARDFIAGAA